MPRLCQNSRTTWRQWCLVNFFLCCLATLRSPGLQVKLLVEVTGKIPRSTLVGVQGIRRSPKMCQVLCCFAFFFETSFPCWFFGILFRPPNGPMIFRKLCKLHQKLFFTKSPLFSGKGEMVTFWMHILQLVVFNHPVETYAQVKLDHFPRVKIQQNRG